MLRLQREQDEEQEEDELTPEERERRYRQEYFEEQRLKREERWKSGQTTNTLGHPSSAIRVEQGKVLGEGSFGQVLEGTLTTEEGEVAVVLKRAKEGVFGAEELLTSELKLSGKALELGGRTAAFMGVGVGYAEVARSACSARACGACGVEGAPACSRPRRAQGPSTRRCPRSAERAWPARRGARRRRSPRSCARCCCWPTCTRWAWCTGTEADNMIYAEGDAVFKLIDFGASAPTWARPSTTAGDGPHDPKAAGSAGLPEEASSRRAQQRAELSGGCRASGRGSGAALRRWRASRCARRPG